VVEGGLLARNFFEWETTKKGWSFLLSEEYCQDEVEDFAYEEFTIEEPVFEILGDIYVCSNCGADLIEIPTYNRFFCENCGLHY